MTIKLIFTHNNELMHFLIQNKEIYYKDKVWKGGVRCIPKDIEFVKKILLSRNKIPFNIVKMFELSEQDQKEYDECKTDEELAEKIRYDCKKQGLKEVI